MVIHLIFKTAHHLTRKLFIQKMKEAVKAQCTQKIKGALSLEIRLFYSMPYDISSCHMKRTHAERGLIRPTNIDIYQPNRQDMQDALGSIADDAALQIVDLRVSQFYSLRPRVEMILNTLGDGVGPSQKRETIT
ncbi:RusA family crossover junction endodeoxyribonuclease [Bacillus sp. 179-C3.3 HS]|uniref:RusA family crossover junction endodeoxyribonuclease n=1 Tax=Bacillus sp. 179-C3.3 HS TaxID=3232162 RepID=UPI0039A292F1